MSGKVYVSVGVERRGIPAGGDTGQFLVKTSPEDYDISWASVSGTSAERQPSNGVSPRDTDDGVRGDSVNYARQDHQHPLNVDDLTLPSKDGTASAGDDDYYARRDHVHPQNNYPNGLVLDATANVFSSEANLPSTHVAGRIAFVIVS